MDAGEKLRRLWESPDPSTPMGARVVIAKACEGNPDLRTALDLIMSERRAQIEEREAMAKSAHDRGRTAKATAGRRTAGQAFREAVAQSLALAIAQRAQPFTSNAQAAESIAPAVNVRLAAEGLPPRAVRTIRREVKKLEDGVK